MNLERESLLSGSSSSDTGVLGLCVERERERERERGKEKERSAFRVDAKG